MTKLTAETYKQSCDDVLLSRAKSASEHPEDCIAVASRGDSREMIHYNLMRMHYNARVFNNFDVSEHPFLELVEPDK